MNWIKHFAAILLCSTLLLIFFGGAVIAQDVSRTFLKDIDDSTTTLKFGRYRIELRDASDTLDLTPRGLLFGSSVKAIIYEVDTLGVGLDSGVPRAILMFIDSLGTTLWRNDTLSNGDPIILMSRDAGVNWDTVWTGDSSAVAADAYTAHKDKDGDSIDVSKFDSTLDGYPIDTATAGGSNNLDSGSILEWNAANSEWQPMARLNKTTGWLTGGQITINAGDSAKIDISAGKAYIITGTDKPVGTIISWTAQTARDPALATRSKWVGVKDSSGAVQFVYDIEFDPIERRTTAILGRIWDKNGSGPNITNVGDYERPAWGLLNAFQDFVLEYGSWNVSGNVYSANGANLLLDKSAGVSYRYHAEDAIGQENVHADAAQTPRNLYAYHLQGVSTTTSETDIDSDYYDSSGVRVALPNNQWSVQEVWFFPVSLTCHVLYGQIIYDSKNDGIDGITTETKIRNTDILSGAILRAYLVLEKGCTDLTDDATAEIRCVSMGGGGGGGDAGLWTKTGTNLSPTTAGDDVLLNTGETFSITDMTTGSIPIIGASGLLSQDNANLSFDNANNVLIGNRIRLGTNGSSASPAFSWASDPDLGFYRVSENSLGISAGNAEVLRLSNAEIYASKRLKLITGAVFFSGSDLLFGSGNSTVTKMILKSDGNVGVGIDSPSSIFHIKADIPGVIGSHSAGQLIIQNPTNSVWSNAVITGYESDAAGNPDQQLWYFGNASGSNSDITMLNRRASSLHLGTNGTTRLTIDGGGKVGIGTTTPLEQLSVVGNIATGDTATGDVDVFHYFSTDGSYLTEYLKWDDGLGRFEISDDLDVTGTAGIDSLVTSNDTITDFAGTNLTVTAGVLNATGGFNWQDSAGEPPFWVDSAKHADSADHADTADYAVESADNFVDPFFSGDVTYTGSLIGWGRRGEFPSLDSLNIDLPDTGLGIIISNWIVKDTGGLPLDSVYCCWGDSLSKCTVVTHPSVTWADNGIFGDYDSRDTSFDSTSPRGVMVVTPYNLGSVCENPSILATHGKDSLGNFNWRSWGSDTTQNPIITPYELNLFCSDTSNKDPNGDDYSPYYWNFFSDGTVFPGHEPELWVAWRAVGYDTSVVDTPAAEAIWLISTDGSRDTIGDDSGHLSWSDPTMILVDTGPASAMISPFVLQFTGGRHRMWVVNKVADTANYMRMFETDGSPDAEYWDTLGISSVIDNDTLRGAMSDSLLELWHPNALVWSPNVLIGLFCYGQWDQSGAYGELYVAESNDGGYTWRVRDSVFMPYDTSGVSWFDDIIYRSAAWWNVYPDKVTMDVFWAGDHTTSSGNWDIGHAETYWTQAVGGSSVDTVRHVAQLTTVTVEKYQVNDSVILTYPLDATSWTTLTLDSALADDYSHIFFIKGWIPYNMTMDTLRLKVNASSADSVIIEAYVLYGPDLLNDDENEAIGLWWFTTTPDTLSAGNQILSFVLDGSPPDFDSTAHEGDFFKLKLQVKHENAGERFYPKWAELIGREIK